MDNTLIEKLVRWQTLRMELEKMDGKVAEEMTLRKEIFGQAFPAPKEGTQNFTLNDGFVLKGIYKIDRKIDEAALPAVLLKIRELNYSPDTLIRYKPDLAVTAYKALPDSAKLIMDEALISKPASPALEIIPPKAAK